jgi:predicted nuclease with RNAse H fold
MGLKGLRKKMTAHELDAATAALVGYYYLQGKAEEIGAREEGLIILPLKDRP